MNRFGKSLMTLLAVGLFAAAFGANTQHGQGTGGGPEKITQSSGNGGVVANTNSGKSSVGNKNTVPSEAPGEAQVPNNGGGTGNGGEWVIWGLVAALVVVLIVIAVMVVLILRSGSRSKDVPKSGKNTFVDASQPRRDKRFDEMANNEANRTYGHVGQPVVPKFHAPAQPAVQEQPAVPAQPAASLEDVRKAVAESENRIVDYLEKVLMNNILGEITRTSAPQGDSAAPGSQTAESAAELESAQSELAAAKEKLKELESAQSELAAAKEKLKELESAQSELAAANEKLKELESAQSELETKLTAANEAAANKQAELESAKSDFETKLAAANEAAKNKLEQKTNELNRKFDDAINERDGFYGKKTEELRDFLLKTQNVDAEHSRMLIAAWLRLVGTKQVSPNDLRVALAALDSTVYSVIWERFRKKGEEEAKAKEDEEESSEAVLKLHAVRGYIAPLIKEILDGSGLEFMWPAPKTKLEALREDEFRVESGYRAVRYATCGMIKNNGAVVTKSRVVCYDE